MPQDGRTQLRAWLNEHGWTQERLAHEAGVTPAVITRLLQGTGPALETAAALERVTGLPITIWLEAV